MRSSSLARCNRNKLRSLGVGPAASASCATTRDLAAAHTAALKLLLEGHGGSFNLGTGFPVRDILSAIKEATGREAPRVIKPRRPGDSTYLVADPSAAREVLNFRPSHSDLPAIIGTAWAWHQKAHPLKQK